MEINLLPLSFTSEDWNTIIGALYESAGSNMSRAKAIKTESVYSDMLAMESLHCRSVAEYIENHIL